MMESSARVRVQSSHEPAHLDVLARAGLIDRTKVGRVVSVKLTAAPLREAKNWLTRYEAFWSGSLDKLQRRLERGR